jgi:hypothetical protein
MLIVSKMMTLKLHRSCVILETNKSLNLHFATIFLRVIRAVQAIEVRV